MVKKAINRQRLYNMLIEYSYVKTRTRKAIEDTIKVAEEAKRVEDKIDAVETLQEVGPQVAAQEFQKP